MAVAGADQPGSLPTQPDRPRVVVYDPAAKIKPGLSSYNDR